MDAYETRVKLEKGGKSTTGTARVQPRTPGERAARAAKLWFIFFVCAIPTVIFPPHIPYPTAIIITGTVLAILRFRETESLLSLDAPCPTCGAVGKLKASGPVRDGRQLHCEGCGFMADLRLLPRVVANTVAAPP